MDTATAAEVSNGSASRRGLHLVVMGHVDAGKSTLMGRLLHDLGQVSQKEVHKNQRESAQAGKVRVRGVTSGTCCRHSGQITLSSDCAGSRLVLAECVAMAAEACTCRSATFYSVLVARSLSPSTFFDAGIVLVGVGAG